MPAPFSARSPAKRGREPDGCSTTECSRSGRSPLLATLPLAHHQSCRRHWPCAVRPPAESSSSSRRRERRSPRRSTDHIWSANDASRIRIRPTPCRVSRPHSQIVVARCGSLWDHALPLAAPRDRLQPGRPRCPRDDSRYAPRARSPAAIVHQSRSADAVVAPAWDIASTSRTV